MPKIPEPYVYDLFGEVPVTTQDIDKWLICVPRMDPLSPRAEWYVKGYNVADKIRTAKMRGTFHDLRPPGNEGIERWFFM